MERFLLIWDEMDEYVGLGRIFVGGALSGISGEVAIATRHAASQVQGWKSIAARWLSRDKEPV